jgi:hypothetical protein
MNPRLRIRDAEALWKEHFVRTGWEILPAPESYPYFDFQAQKGENGLLVDIKSMGPGGRIHLSQAKYPPNEAWAIALTWWREERPELILVPGTRWLEPSGPFKARPNKRSSLCPEWVLEVENRYAGELMAHRATLRDAASGAPAPALMMAQSARRRGRELVKPDFMPPSVRTGKPNLVEPLNRNLNASLLGEFKEYLHANNLEGTEVLENYLAWLIGVDCLDTPYKIAQAQAELQHWAKRATPPPAITAEAPAPPVRVAGRRLARKTTWAESSTLHASTGNWITLE